MMNDTFSVIFKHRVKAKHFQGPKSQSFQEITYADEIAPSCVPKVSQIFA